MASKGLCAMVIFFFVQENNLALMLKTSLKVNSLGSLPEGLGISFLSLLRPRPTPFLVPMNKI